MRIYSRMDRIVLAFLIPASLYLMVAMGTFQWRHPWMTSTEQLAYVGRALTEFAEKARAKRDELAAAAGEGAA